MDFFLKAAELRERGEAFATATVVRAEKPTSGKPGDKAIVTQDGELHGWIGGSCAEPTVVSQALEAIAEDRSRLIRLSTQAAGTERSGVTDLPMTCYSGGTMEIYIEPHSPRTRLLIVGGQHVAQALARLGRAMGYEVVAAAPEEDGHRVSEVDRHVHTLEELSEHVTPQTYVVVATHGHYDELALVPALRSGARYVGLVASRKRAQSVLDYLRGQGLGAAELEALHVPAGLDIHARRGEEIALSILAEIIALRGAEEHAATAPADPAQQETATDPICGMSVEVTHSKHTFEHAGEVYHFCCAGCRDRFAEDPARYLQTR